MGREQPLSTRNPGRKSLAPRCNMLARLPPRLCVEYRNSGAAAPIEHSSVLCPVARPPVSEGQALRMGVRDEEVCRFERTRQAWKFPAPDG
jgi:hypothetical protein